MTENREESVSRLAPQDGAARDGQEESVPRKENGERSSVRNSKVQMAKVPFPPLKMPLGYDEICQILPHRYPFLLVDRLVELEPGVRCVGIKNVTANEEYFLGHFPGHPVMPGVLMLEAMAQVAGVLILVSRNTPGALSYFAAMEKVRFRQPVRPGDQLVAEAQLEVLRGPYCKVHVEGRVDGQVVVEADYTFMTADTTSSSAVVQHAAASNGGLNSTAQAGSTASTAVSLPAAQPVPATASSAKPDVFIAPREGTGETYIHPSAMVDPTAQLDQGVWVGPRCIIEGNTRIGANTILESNVLIKRGTSVGARCRIWPNVILGHEPQDMKYHGEESFLRIGDDNMLREMVTIHRATGEGEATVIGNGNLLMAYVHVGHNCVIGSNNMISNSTGVSGHVTIEDKVVIGGFVGVHQFVHIGKMAMVGGVSKVVQDVPPFCIADGRPSKIHGLNIRGLRRNGVPPEQRTQVSNAFKLLYRSDLNTSQALERIHAEIPRSETLDYFIDFVERVRVGRLGRQDETPHL
jgi:UDP-N-acetylglucosamine acyltransferase